MYTIRLISCYFGELKPEFYLWLNSCRYNKSIDFLFVTDQKVDLSNCPENVEIMRTTLRDIKHTADEIFSLNVELSTPYKLCDYKVAYGLIFADKLKDYDFWGYCDSDMVLGQIRKFVTDEILEIYDKILPLGHLSIYRNTEEVNRKFMECPDIMDYKEVFSSVKIFQFDETPGIYSMYKSRGWKMLKYIPFVDIVAGYNYRLTKYIYAKRLYRISVKNHSHQVFCFDRGKVLEYYSDKKGVLDQKEYIYIHSSKRHYQCSYKKIPEQYIFTPVNILKIENISDGCSILNYSKKTNCIIEKIKISFMVWNNKVSNKIKMLTKWSR